MKTILCLLMVWVGVSAVFAQEKVIQKSDFDPIIKNASEMLKTKPYRITVVSETTVNGQRQENSVVRTVVEVASADKRRSVRESKSANQTSKRELIRFGNKTYSRENEGQWIQTAAQNRPADSGLKTVSEQNDYQSLGKEMLNGQNTNVYQRKSVRKMIDNSNNEEVLSNETVKYWFDDDGMLLKRELDRENTRGNKTFHIKRTLTFAYDSNIKVIAPQIAGN